MVVIRGVYRGLNQEEKRIMTTTNDHIAIAIKSLHQKIDDMVIQAKVELIKMSLHALLEMRSK